MIFILLPAFNEEKNLEKIFFKIQKLKDERKLNLTVVLVDDCSKDNTFKFRNKRFRFKFIYLRHKKNSGLSIAMETGFKKIHNLAKKNDIVVTLDSDNTHPIHVIHNMIRKINYSCDLVVASRFTKYSKVKGVSNFRKFLTLAAKYIFKIMYPFKNLNDYTCNFRAYKFLLINEILKNKSFFKNEDFNIAAKIMIFLVSNFRNLRLSEVPFKLRYDHKIGESKMKLTKTIMLTLKLIFFKKFD